MKLKSKGTHPIWNNRGIYPFYMVFGFAHPSTTKLICQESVPGVGDKLAVLMAECGRPYNGKRITVSQAMAHINSYYGVEIIGYRIQKWISPTEFKWVPNQM